MTRSEADNAAPQPRLSCWFCNERFEPDHVDAQGILRSRSEDQGGPYRLFVCPS